MSEIKAKKALGQHFLTDQNLAKRIATSLLSPQNAVLEIGPGTGVLTQFLFEKYGQHLHLIEIDTEAITFLEDRFPLLKPNIHKGDVLRFPFDEIFYGEFLVIGNFPYNISSQIILRLLDFKNRIPEIVGMFQKEMAQRLMAPPGSKTYGITSVFVQTWYNAETVINLKSGAFFPPPKVDSTVLRFTRNERKSLPCDERLFRNVVKMAFNQRRKTLRNSLKSLSLRPEIIEKPVFNLRPEQLSVEDFIALTLLIESQQV